MRTIIATTALTVMLAGPAKALLSGDLAAGNLRTGCSQMTLEVRLSGYGEVDEGLQHRLENAAESRLRAASLFADKSTGQALFIEILATGRRSQNKPTISRRDMILLRYIADTGHGREGLVHVWAMGGVGSFDDTMSEVAGMLDKFLTEYLRANPECGR